MTDAIRVVIDAADVEALRAQVVADPALADADVHFGKGGKNVVPPLHYVCDAAFRELATEEQALAMADVLLEAGVDPGRAYAKSGDTFLIAAASLGVESVGLRLVECGVDITSRGLFGATALHWAAFMGLERLARALVEAGAELELIDTEYDCTPLQWALHAWTDGTNGHREGLSGVVRVLVDAGAVVPADAAAPLTRDSDAQMREALEARPSR